MSGYDQLSVRGKALYRAKCKELIDDGELRKCHLQTLVFWADNYDRYWELRKEVSAEGSTFKTHNKFGEEVISVNPKVKMMNDAMKMANQILTDFGATLKQSRKLGKEKHAENPLDKFMNENE